MAKKKSKKRSRKKRTPARRANNAGSSHWVSMFIGLAAGLGIAAIIWYKMRAPAPLVATTPAPAIQTDAAPANPPAKRPKPAPIEATGDGFDFYDLLPNQEVVVSDDFAERRGPDTLAARAPIEAISEPGDYVIQAGSFRSASDAERMKATLGLQGMQAQIVPVTVNAQRFHRVRIGPVSDLNELNEYRRRLRESSIDVLLTRVK
ncbi:MAG: SPOR domain-containing protein [Pseudomonadota bacterium]